ncbi:putative adrenomedullin-5-like protein [Ctenodactylus gundi]
MTACILILLLLLTSSALGDPDSGRRPWHQGPPHRGRLCSLGTCQTHRLPEIIYWLRSASAKELSGKASREPQDPHSYGRRRRREAKAQRHTRPWGGGQDSARRSG